MENGLKFVGFLPAKMNICKQTELCGEGWDECTHYRATELEELHAEESMMLLGQSTLRQW